MSKSGFKLGERVRRVPVFAPVAEITGTVEGVNLAGKIYVKTCYGSAWHENFLWQPIPERTEPIKTIWGDF